MLCLLVNAFCYSTNLSSLQAHSLSSLQLLLIQKPAKLLVCSYSDRITPCGWKRRDRLNKIREWAIVPNHNPDEKKSWGSSQWAVGYCWRKDTYCHIFSFVINFCVSGIGDTVGSLTIYGGSDRNCLGAGLARMATAFANLHDKRIPSWWNWSRISGIEDDSDTCVIINLMLRS